MTLVSLPSPISWPAFIGPLTSSVGLFSTATLDAAGEYVSAIFCAREDMTVSHVGFRAGTASGSPTAEVRIETLDASGLPSGTLWATNTNGTTGTISSNTNVLQALTASASITKGKVFCVKILYASGTSVIVQHSASLVGFPINSGLPYMVINTGTPTKSNISNNAPTIALGSSSTTFYQVPGTWPIASVSGNTFNNTNSAKRGLRFTPPMNCRAIGLRWYNSAQIGDFNAVLYNDAGTELSSSSTAFDGDHNSVNNGGVIVVYFDNAVTLTAGTTYRIAIEPTTSTNVNITTVALPSADYRSASPAGTTAHYTTFATSSWTDTATDTVPLMEVVIDQIDNGAGSGGGGGQRVFGG